MNYRSVILRFVKLILIITIVIVAAGILFFSNSPSSFYTPAFPFLLAFFALASIAVFYFMMRAIEKRPAKFVSLFLLTTMVKLFSYMTFMITYALLNREDARAFIVTFFVLYLVYSIAEVAAVLRVNKEYN